MTELTAHDDYLDLARDTRRDDEMLESIWARSEARTQRRAEAIQRRDFEAWVDNLEEE
jgi:hypothetical protein